MRATVLKDILGVVLGVSAAVLVYSLAGSAGPSVLIVLNAFSALVIYYAIRRGEIFGAMTGTVCGLVQDAFSLGVYGLGGVTKTLLGFWTGFVARRIDVTPFLRQGVFLLVMSALELGAWILLTALVRQEAVNLHGGLILLQPPVTAALVRLLVAADLRFLDRRRRA